MTNLNAMPPMAPAQKSVLLPMLAVGCCTFVIGGAAAFGFVQWQAQKAQIASMEQMLTQLQQTQQQQPQSAEDIATRNASLDLLAITNAATTPTATQDVTPVAAAAPAQVEGNAPSVANQIRAIASRASDPMVANAIATNNTRQATISNLIGGINELADHALNGEYNIFLDEADPTGKRIHISFVGYEDRQAEIETLLVAAAQDDEIALDAGVVRDDGSVDGKLLLANLVKRSLLNGSPDERAIGAQMRQQIAALVPVAPEAPESGANRFYTVESGDSLAFISLQFYGDTRYYTRIFNANRDILAQPDKITIGQRLVIPSA